MAPCSRPSYAVSVDEENHTGLEWTRTSRTWWPSSCASHAFLDWVTPELVREVRKSAYDGEAPERSWPTLTAVSAMVCVATRRGCRGDPCLWLLGDGVINSH